MPLLLWPKEAFTHPASKECSNALRPKARDSMRAAATRAEEVHQLIDRSSGISPLTPRARCREYYRCPSGRALARAQINMLWNVV